MKQKNKTRLARAAMTLLLALLTTIGAWAQSELTVYEGTTTNQYVPAYIYYFDDFTRSQFVIPADDLAEMKGGTISSIKFYTTSGNVPYTTVSTVDVYLMEVDYTTMTGLEPKANGTIVYQGTLDVVTEGEGGSLTITLSTSYTYSGGNLLIGIENTTDAGYKNISFYGQTVTGASWGGSSGTSLSSVTGSQRNFIPKTTFTYEPASTGCDMPTSISVSSITHNSATVTWDGEGSKWNLRYKASTDADYTLVESLTSKTYNLTGLAENTAYSVGIQTDCGGSTSSFKSTSFTTKDPNAAPTNLQISDITASSAKLSWTPGYQETSWTVKYKKSSETDYSDPIPVSGTPTLNLTGLEGLTTYNVQVFNGENPVSGNFTTAATFPYSQDFSGSGIPTGWAQYSGLLADVMDGTALTSPSYGWSNGTNHSVLDGNHIYANIYGTSCKKWIVTPAIPLGSNARLTFDVAYTAYSSSATDPATDGEDDKLVVLISTDNMATWTILRQWDNAGSEYVLNELTPSALHLNFDLSANAGQSVIVAFYAESTVDNADNIIHVDNVVFEVTPSCEKPQNVAINYTGGLTAEVSWEGEASAYNIDVNGTVANNVTSPYTLEGLELSTTYNVKVQSNCGNSTSEWTNPVSFTTDQCMPEDMCEITFELTDSYGDGWNGAYIDVVDVATGASLGHMSNQNVAKASESEEAEGTKAGGAKAAETETYTLAVCDGRDIQFVWHSGSYDDECSYVVTDVNGEVIFGGSNALSEPVNYTVNCSVNDCRKPTDLAASEIGPHSAKLSWTENGEATAWKICVNGDTENLIDADSNPYTLTGLAAETPYTVKVAPVCEVEKWSDEITLTTEIACPAPTDVAAGNITSTSAEISWTGNADATSYNLRYRTARGFNYGFEPAEPWAVDDFDPCTTYDGDQTQCYGFDGETFTNIPFTGSTIAFQSQGGNLSSHSGNAFGLMINPASSSQAADDWFILPELTINEGDIFSFWGREITSNYGAETINVGIYGETDGTFSATLAENVEVYTTDWTEYNYDLSAYVGQTIRLAVNCVSLDVFGFMIDDIFVGNPNDDTWDVTLTNVTSPNELTGLTPSTDYEVQVQAVYADGTSAWVGTSFITNVAYPAPTDLTVEDLGTTTATISWTAAEGATGYAYQYKKASATEWSTEATITGTSVELSGLDDATAYNFRVKAVYAGGVSSYATIDFITDCLPKDLPYSYDFQDLVELNCWSLLNTDNANSIGITSNNGNYALYFSSYYEASSYDQYLISPTLNATSPVAVEFSYMNTNSSNETFKVGYSTTTPELTEFTWGDEIISSDNENWTQYKNIFPAGTKYVAIYYYSNYQYYLMIDDFSFTVPESTNITFAKEGYATYYNGEKDVVLPAGMKAHVVTDGSTSLTYAKIADGDMDENVVPAETAVLLQVEPSTEDQTLPVYLVTPSAAAYAGTNLLFGSDVDATTTGGEKFYKLTYSNNNDKFGWYWGATDGGAFESPAHKAWLALGSSGAPFLGLPGWEDTTGIVPVSVNPEDGEWYTLQGIKVGKKPSTAGVYIHNGRKVLIP